MRLGAPDRRFPQNIVSYGCTAPWHLGPNDGYFFQRLPWHMVQAGRLDELRDLLLDFSWLLAKLRATAVQSLVADCDLLPDDQEIAFVQNALQLSGPALVRDPDQLPGHLAGRLRGFTEAGVSALVECALAASPDGRRALSGSLRGDIFLWDLETGQPLHQLEREEGLRGAVLVAGGRRAVLATITGRSVLLCDFERREIVASFIGDTPMTCVDAVREDLFVAGSADGAVHILRLLT